MSDQSLHLGRKKKRALAVSPITRRRTPTPTLSKSQRSSVGVRVTGFRAQNRNGGMAFGYTQTREARQRRPPWISRSPISNSRPQQARRAKDGPTVPFELGRDRR